LPTFTGTSSNDVITPQFVSPGVIATDAARPSDAADFIQGGSGDDTLDGGGGADTLDGGPGSDSLVGGAGDDIFIWNPGGGSDAISGGSGSDTLLFNGSNIGEKIDLSANGAALRVTRDVAVVTIDATSVEKVNVLALGGPDTITVHDLAGSGVKQVAVDFGQQADGANDTVAVVGTAGADQFTLTSAGGVATVGGLSEALTVSHFENLDRLAFDGGGGADTFTLTGSGVGDLLIAQANNGAVRVGFGADNGFGADVSNVGSIALRAGIGDDTISAGNGLATLSKFIFDGGAGNDQITGGDGADSVIGGAGDDTIAGGRGDDTVSMGSGNDIVSWNPGDGSDLVDGGSGVDTLQFNGSNIGEKIDISLNGTGFRLTRDVANIAFNGAAIEQVNFRALGGADTITVHDLAGSGVKQVSLDLFGSPNSATGDGAVDTVNISGAGATRHYTFTASG
jgi:Ca2+-binding RTX toxin-like protein